MEHAKEIVNEEDIKIDLSDLEPEMNRVQILDSLLKTLNAKPVEGMDDGMDDNYIIQLEGLDSRLGVSIGYRDGGDIYILLHGWAWPL